MNPILCLVFTLLALSWIFPRYAALPSYDYGGFTFLFSEKLSWHKIDFQRIALIDFVILAGGGIALTLRRKS